MNNSKKVFILGLTIMALVSSGCATVKRVNVDKTVDLSGRWNDTDARTISKAMILDCTNQSWLPLFVGKQGRTPVVIVGDIKNQSSEHINTDIITKALEHSLINSGKVKFVASKMERGQVRDERNDQQKGETSPETMKRKGRETGADYMLIGSINSIKDETRGRYVIMYQVNLELVDLETNEKVWLGEDNIKKVVSKNKFSL
ncbi:MAG: penicillin-binding protein activator LpoB [Candidatus Omnitrophica bacterium]|nr:penicillin-binding protein activator LpoB [Candidatus Omnitrophota bacterium]